jgi:iron complex transport system substrate-binding protein
LTINLYAGERIVTLSPAVNEILYALDEGKNIVGNTTYATYPKESIKKPKVGGYFSVSLEKVVALKPTLVLMQKNNLPLKPKLQKLGIKTEFIKISTLNDIKEGIIKIGKLVGKSKKAKTLTDEIDKAIESTKGILKDKKILVVFGRQFDLKREVFVSGNSIYFADIIKSSQNLNAFDENSTKQPILSYEGILACNPDIIYILAHTISEQEDVKKMIKPWLKLPVTASKAKSVYVTTKKYAGMPSQRVVNFIHDFKEVLEDAKSKLSKLQD